jgi:hypothetical protein
MKILFLNHKKSQCGIYELGNRIFGLIDQNIMPCVYREINTLKEFHSTIYVEKPDAIIYNYYPATMPFLDEWTIKMLPKIKHFAIIHDPLDPNFIARIDKMFNAWIIHDQTNTLSSKKKFTTCRPIPRYERTKKRNDHLTIGTHGFPVSPWKMYDTMVEYINESFDEVTINMNLTVASFGGTIEQVNNVAKKCFSKITKPEIHLNITHDYIPTEAGMIDWLANNTMNIYFYNPPNQWQGVGASADLAIASQSSLAVNDSYMYRHINSILGSCSRADIKNFIHNDEDVKKLYLEWSPERMTNDYKTMIEKTL